MSGKNRIDKHDSIDLLRSGFGLQVQVMNFYQFRIRDEEQKGVFYDWYHTTGALVETEDGNFISHPKIKTAEEVANFIKQQVYK